MFNYIAQDRPDLAVCQCIVSTHGQPHRRGRGVPHTHNTVFAPPPPHPRGIVRHPRDQADGTLRIGIDSDWVGDVFSRRSCSGVRSAQRRDHLPLKQDPGTCGAILQRSGVE